MPRHNLAVPPSSTVEGKAILIGLLCTLPTYVDIQTENGEGLAAVYEQKSGTQTSKGKGPYIGNMGTLNAIMEQQAGKLYVYRHTDKKDAYRLKDTAMQSDPVIAEEIKAWESEGVPYVLEFRPKVDLVDGRGDGALDVWDTEGVAEGTPLYRRASQNQTHLKEIEEVNADQVAAIKNILSIVGNMGRNASDTPARTRAFRFKYFLTDVYEVLSSLKGTNAPKALLPCAVTTVFAEYKKKYWDDGVMKLADKEAAEELEASAAVLLDERYVADYLKFTKSAEQTPPGPSSEEFDVTFGLLSQVDKDLTSAFRNLIVGLRDTVEPHVESLLEEVSSTLEGSLDTSNGQDTENDAAMRKVQLLQLNVCIRNYSQCLYNIALEFVRLHRTAVPNMEAQLQAVMRNHISGVNRKFWPVLESCLEQLCDSSVAKDIKQKYHVLTEQLTNKSQLMNQLKEEDQPTSVRGVGGVEGKSIKPEEEATFSNLLKIVESLGFYKQIASSSPEESPLVPETIVPDDRISVCAALGFVNKARAAALFTFLKRLQEYLDHVEYKEIAKEEELPFVEKFRHVDWHILKALQGKEGFSYVHNKMDAEACDKIMTSMFKEYFDECWPHVAAVLEGGGQEDVIEKFKAMAHDISEWKQPAGLEQKLSQIIKNLKSLVDINAAWFLAGMLGFVQGSEKREFRTFTQQMWTHALCPRFKPYNNVMYQTRSSHLTVCLPSATDANMLQLLDLIEEQTLHSWDEFVNDVAPCYSFWDILGRSIDLFGISSPYLRGTVRYSENGEAYHVKSDKQDTANMLAGAAKMGIDTSCGPAFRAHWYDASERLIDTLCREKFWRTLPEKEPEGSKWKKQMLRHYDLRVITGPPGITLEGGKINRGYQGFVMCHEEETPTMKAILDKHLKHEDYPKNKVSLLDAMAQRTCKYKKYKGKSRDYKVYYSTLRVSEDGRILILNPNHHGAIADCYERLRGRFHSMRGSGRETRDVSQRNRTEVLTQEDLLKVIQATNKDDMEQFNEYLANFDSNWNETNVANATIQEEALRMQLQGERYEGCTNPVCSFFEPMSAYWPIVWSALGAAAVFATSKAVWNRCKAQFDRGYKAVTAADATTV
eukprot:Blabericola_migrator_1__506@NODE_1122_length_5377_cov_95_501695_g478_i5_p1_GENE_NODE_1122_length_5377_cov_95_501695_g478_i5NODE_1122_length_5377_cov_95_501695_g478_i5_p1_ORF_typecomplete_len1107_score262_47BroN/PF02498_17/1_7e03BroN/PF02498_17/2_4e03BroN/PF02498_17/2_4HBB/PF06777_11/0_42HBB/PF06777_11/1_8e03_NODE_1122_length_5377_cov_95_501695_g478_i51693489